MLRSIKVLLLVLISAGLQTACGVAIHTTSESTVGHANFVTFEIYEITRRGYLDHVYSDCINLNQVNDEGSIYIETPNWREELTMHWRQDYSSIVFVFEHDYSPISTSSFDRYYFKRGQVAEVSIGTGYSSYLVKFSGPNCHA